MNGAARRLVLLAACLAAGASRACELDGLSHGYGPTSALFAGAHRYQALNGLADEAEERAAVAPPPEVAKPAKPPRSFAGWAARKTRAAAANEAPARWTAPVGASAQPSAAAPPQAAPQQGETRQRPPGGGPLP